MGTFNKKVDQKPNNDCNFSPLHFFCVIRLDQIINKNLCVSSKILQGEK